eukprot:gnl/MRDRNA2_/MRDRNA2_95020_c0_seq1.p1 gnl/MRDRNA2_/MRDRNA2_95020_c0~~gnl/MRDRNA2_/MRDRNA2_95020_c0_seq1.p1  ORF type:complete len:687 (+),score=123.82 gnl/MRDRNA2_/MRDRNA2_95020_c0_seq1:135-2195(+)
MAPTGPAAGPPLKNTLRPTKNDTQDHVDRHTAHTPHYNLWGQQHHRNPQMSRHRSHHEETSRMTNPFKHEKTPPYKSRTELQQARKVQKIPDKSYDFDGDGHVGQRDFFLGKHFDQDHEDRLRDHEHARAVSEINSGFIDRFHYGHDRAGVMRAFPTQQKRGMVLTSDNQDQLGSVYPPHWNANHAPPHVSLTELQLDRKAEKKNFHAKLKENWDLNNPQLVAEKVFCDYDDVPVKHIRERAEADHQLARVRGGLLPVNTELNPERQYKTVSLEYVPEPAFQTRSQLLETRKELQKEDLDRQRNKGEEEHVMWSVRQSEQEKACFDFRRPAPMKDMMTLAKLKNQRKQDRIEYDMANFFEEKRQFPRFSDQPHPWWMLQKRGYSAPAKHNQLRPAVSEPCLKITDSPRGGDNKPSTAPLESMYPPTEGERLQKIGQQKWKDGSQTVKRWTTELIEKGNLRNVPRYFDNLKPMCTCAKDFEPLDNTSSMEPIRTAALEKQKKAREHGRNHTVTSQLFTGTSAFEGTLPNSDSGGHGERSGTGGRASVIQSAASSQQRGLEMSGSTRAASTGTRGRAQGNETFIRRSNPLAVDTSLVERALQNSASGHVQDLAQGATQTMYQASQAQTRMSVSRQSAEPRRPSTVSHVSEGEIVKSFGVRTGGFQRVDQISRASEEEHRRAAAQMGTL